MISRTFVLLPLLSFISSCKSQSPEIIVNTQDTSKFLKVSVRDILRATTFGERRLDTIQIINGQLEGADLSLDTSYFFIRVPGVLRSQGYIDTFINVEHGDCLTRLILVMDAFLIMDGCGSPKYPRLYSVIKFDSTRREDIIKNFTNPEVIRSIVQSGSYFNDRCSVFKSSCQIKEYKYFYNSFVEDY